MSPNVTGFVEKMEIIGRNDQPERLYRAWYGREIDVATLREWILSTWQAAEWPASLGHRHWLEMFDATGFVTDDGAFDPPSSLTLYRGAARERARGFSWTWERDKAEWFAHRSALFGFPAAVFEVEVPRTMLLAVISDAECRGEHEAILNPRRLRGRWAPRKLLDVPAPVSTS